MLKLKKDAVTASNTSSVIEIRLDDKKRLSIGTFSGNSYADIQTIKEAKIQMGLSK